MTEHAPAAHKGDTEGARIGMWLFLFTELLLFGGLFLLYAVYFHRYPEAFHSGGKVLDRIHGTVNTVVLITSSLFVACSVSDLQRGNKKRARLLLLATVVCALIFLVIKYFEWSAKIHHGIYPNGPELVKLPPGEMLFFNLYYMMTGLHGIHVIIGGAAIIWVWQRIGTGAVTREQPVVLENVGLYWHLVDLVWIYLFPLFYLVV
ncbi:Cytochrome c oxidase subunit III family protein [uncultured delta proteobacterium]|uniref:Cytochrome c oxidase subunit III family protein n=1 Tax=uncultured delta proteobacterium TaxID=34034 RepID=A0A212IYV9_9DELT|nr:Cytochrome c oxidase subunit III family protein [uncultured delta proteobacterium]